MMITCLPSAVMNGSSGIDVAGHPLVLEREELHREVDALRARARGSAGRAAWVAPPQRQMASNSARSCVGGDVDADVDARPEDDALGLHLAEPAVEVPLLHLEVGDAVAEQAADPVGALEDGDRVPGAGELLRARPGRRGRSRRPRPSCRSATLGGCGTTQPSSQARSMMLASICLIVTGSLLIPSTHEASQGAGQSLPVNSGKLFVACSRSIAAPPLVAVDQVVPVGDQVAERAALVAERDPAVHAPGISATSALNFSRLGRAISFPRMAARFRAAAGLL